jgi:Sec-independent protein secretion pathway component TatC
MSVVRPVGHEDRLSLVEHLDELRTRLIVCIAVFMVAFSVCYWQNEWLLQTINRPLQSTQNLDGKKRSKDPLEEAARFQLRSGDAQKATAQALRTTSQVMAAIAAGQNLSPSVRRELQQAQRELDLAARAQATAAAAVPTNRSRQPITLGVTEPFITTFTVAAYAALLLALPFILYQAYAFVLPAFSEEERRVALPLMVLVPFLFAAAAIPVTLGIVWIFANFLELSTYITNLVTLIGLGIAVDYSLLMVYRYREERRAGRDVAAALRRTYRSTGAAVLASGATAIAGFAVLVLSDVRMLQEFGIVTVVDLSVSLLGVLAVLPAVLVLAERRRAAPPPASAPPVADPAVPA